MSGKDCQDGRRYIATPSGGLLARNIQSILTNSYELFILMLLHTPNLFATHYLSTDEDDERGICSFTALSRKKWAQVCVCVCTAIFCHAELVCVHVVTSYMYLLSGTGKVV